MAIKLTRGDGALAVLRESRVRAGWRELAEACPWATGYQTAEFVEIWYAVYAPRFEPVVVHELDAGGALAGLVTLAVERASGRLAVAGDHQAEYQAWLARPQDGDGFGARALRALRDHFPKATLRLRYLPPGAPIGWATADPLLRSMTQLRVHRRPLVRWSDEEGGDASLAKKSNKSRLNRLKRSGEVAVRELEDAAALERVIDDIAVYYDLRQGAANDSVPFRDDPLKRRFHLELMRAGILHAAVLTAGPSVAAAMLSVRSRGYLSVGVFAYSPFLARHSPGKFLVLMLGKKLAEQGFGYLDLTPGGAWKDRFATASDEVHEAVIDFDRARAFRAKASAFGLRAAKTALGYFGVTPDKVRSALAATGATPASQAVVVGGRPRLVYHLDLANRPTEIASDAIGRNDLAALLAFRPAPPWKSLQEFLGHALDRLGEGAHAYTKVEAGFLMHLVWAGERPAGIEGVGEDGIGPFPHKAIVVCDAFTHPDGRGRGYEEMALAQCVADAERSADVRRVYVILPDGGSAIREAAEALGFVRQGVGAEGRSGGQPPPDATPPPPPRRRPAERAREPAHSES
jgi:CelD/BcsL family acetyltransferase involved in cellulose biosynthesis